MQGEKKFLYGDAYYTDGQFFYYAQTDERVPNAEPVTNNYDGTLQMKCDELLVWNMLDIEGVAQFLGIEPTSVPAMVSRKQIIPPQVTVGKSPLWSRPVVQFWKENRPGRGANLKNRGPNQPKSPASIPVPIPDNFDTGDTIVNQDVNAGPIGLKINPNPQPAEPKGNVEVDDALVLADVAREEEAERIAKEKAEAEKVEE